MLRKIDQEYFIEKKIDNALCTESFFDSFMFKTDREISSQRASCPKPKRQLSVCDSSWQGDWCG